MHVDDLHAGPGRRALGGAVPRKGKGCSEGSIAVMASSSDFEADVSSTNDSEVFSYDSNSELYVPVSELSSNGDDMNLPSESDSTCQPDRSGRVGTSRTRMEYDGDSDDSSNPGCWSQLFDNSDSDVFQPESEDPLLISDDATDQLLGMDTSPLYPGCQFSVIESMLMVLRFSLR